MFPGLILVLLDIAIYLVIVINMFFVFFTFGDAELYLPNTVFMCLYQYVTSFLKTYFSSVSVGSILGRGFVMYVLATLILSLIFCY